MTEPVRERVLAAALAALEGIAGVPGLAVERNRDAPIDEFPMLVLVDGGHAAEALDHPYVRYTMTVAVEGGVQAAEGDPGGVGAKLNDLYARAVAALTADPTLGGVAIDASEASMDMDIDRGEGQARTAFFSVAFEVQFQARQGDPYAQF